MKYDRRELRSQVRLKVEVCGRDAQGNVFVQTAYVKDTSFYGARVDGIECLKGPGDIIQIKYKGKTSKFRVMWLGQPGTREHGHLGLRSLEPRKNIWNITPVPAAGNFPPSFETLPRESANAPEPPNPRHEEPVSSPLEKRRYTRHSCLGTVEFRITGNCTVMPGKLTDISLGGCYVQAPGTCLTGTPLELALEACKMRIHLNGRVVAAQSSKGMGIEFVSGCDGLKDLPKFIQAVRSMPSLLRNAPRQRRRKPGEEAGSRDNSRPVTGERK